MEDLKWSSVFFIIISNNFMEEKCVCSVQIWKEVFDYFDREPKKMRTIRLMKMQRKPCRRKARGCWLQKQANGKYDRE